MKEAPVVFAYLRDERGLHETSILHYAHYLRILEAYLERIGVRRLEELSPAVLRAFVTEASRGLSKTSITRMCCSVRVLPPCLYQEGLIGRDLALLPMRWPPSLRSI